MSMQNFVNCSKKRPPLLLLVKVGLQFENLVLNNIDGLLVQMGMQNAPLLNAGPYYQPQTKAHKRISATTKSFRDGSDHDAPEAHGNPSHSRASGE